MENKETNSRHGNVFVFFPVSRPSRQKTMLQEGGGKGKGKDRGSSEGFFFAFWEKKRGALICFAIINGGVN